MVQVHVLWDRDLTVGQALQKVGLAAPCTAQHRFMRACLNACMPHDELHSAPDSQSSIYMYMAHEPNWIQGVPAATASITQS